MTDTNLESLIINDLTEEEYQEALTEGEVNENELYLTDGEDAGATWGSITGTLSNQTDLNYQLTSINGSIQGLGQGLNAKANLTSNTFTGINVFQNSIKLTYPNPLTQNLTVKEQNVNYNKTKYYVYNGTTTGISASKPSDIIILHGTTTNTSPVSEGPQMASLRFEGAVSTSSTGDNYRRLGFAISNNYSYYNGTDSEMYAQVSYNGQTSGVFVSGVLVPASTATGNQLVTAGWTNDKLSTKANLSSPSFSGVPTAPTASSGTSTTQIASTAFVQQEIASAIGNIETALSNI